MEEENSINGIPEDFDGNTLDLIKHYRIDSDSRFEFLKDELTRLYEIKFKRADSEFEFNKKKLIVLQSLLMEIVMTSKFEEQLSLIDRVHKWYLSKILEKKQSELEPANIQAKSQNPSLPLIETHIKPLLNEPRARIYKFPKEKRMKKTSADIISNIESKYYDMINNEKLSFHTTKYKKPSKERQVSEIIKPFDHTELKKQCKTPDLIPQTEESLSNLCFDFRKNNKFRLVPGIDKNKLFNRLPNSQLTRIHSIKRNLAKKKVHIGLKNLEDSLYFNPYAEKEDHSSRAFPASGEALLKQFPKKKLLKNSSINGLII